MVIRTIAVFAMNKVIINTRIITSKNELKIPLVILGSICTMYCLFVVNFLLTVNVTST